LVEKVAAYGLGNQPIALVVAVIEGNIHRLGGSQVVGYGYLPGAGEICLCVRDITCITYL